MDQPVELVPLVCPRCNTPVPAEKDEVAWVCQQCEQGLTLDFEAGLVEQEVFYAAGISPDATGKPFWVADGKVQLARDTYTGNWSKQAQQFWARARKFFIPAFAASLETLITLGTQYILDPPHLVEGQPVHFDAVIFPAQDAPTLAEFIVMGIEAGRKDKLKEVRFSLTLASPVLWILP